MANTAALVLDLPDPSATARLGEALAGAVAGLDEAGRVIGLEGSLGAGKTSLARAFILAMGYSEPVRSPTYTLVEPYEGGVADIFHLDLYRLADPEELEFLGIRDLYRPGALMLVEWPEMGAGVLPGLDLGIRLERQDTGRRARVEARTPAGRELVTSLKSDPLSKEYLVSY